MEFVLVCCRRRILQLKKKRKSFIYTRMHSQLKQYTYIYLQKVFVKTVLWARDVGLYAAQFLRDCIRVYVKDYSKNCLKSLKKRQKQQKKNKTLYLHNLKNEIFFLVCCLFIYIFCCAYIALHKITLNWQIIKVYDIHIHIYICK